jgi:hypothetical protein
LVFLALELGIEARQCAGGSPPEDGPSPEPQQCEQYRGVHRSKGISLELGGQQGIHASS